MTAWDEESVEADPRERQPLTLADFNPWAWILGRWVNLFSSEAQ